MATTEDDFGKPTVRGFKGPGIFRPQDTIGASILDVKPEPALRPREDPMSRSHLATGPVYCAEPPHDRRLRRTVHDASGRPLDGQRPSSASQRPSGLRRIDFVPVKQKAELEGAKRCFGWTNRPTGVQNPEQWDRPPAPGARPSHPVASIGVVALEHRRNFPEQACTQTGVPPPKLCKAPHGSEWGGWAADGSPGRRALQGPWDSLEPQQAGRDVGERFSDARVRRYPELTDADTSHLTRWHLDRQRDVDPRKAKRQHLNCAIPAGPVAAPPAGAASLSARGPTSGVATLHRPAAGKPTNNIVEGSMLQWYGDFRRAELAAPASAR